MVLALFVADQANFTINKALYFSIIFWFFFFLSVQQCVKNTFNSLTQFYLTIQASIYLIL